MTLPAPTDSICEAVAAERVPILDLTSYLRGDAGAREQAGADLRHIQENLGFYYIVNHGVPADLIARSFEKVAAFFAQPEEEKRKILVNRHQLGFVPSKASIMKTELTDANTKADLNEGLSLMRERSPDDPKVVADVRFSGLNQWPEGVPGLRETLLEYHVEMDALAKRLLPLYALALDKPADYFAPFFEDAHYYNRNSLYPAVENADGHEALGAHTDHNFMALLPMSAEPGLLYATPSGNWCPAPHVAGAIVVNTGEFLKRWTNGRFLPTPHRVTVPKRDRYALTFHYSPADETVADPLDTCVGPDNPRKFEPKTFIQHMTDYIDAVYVPQQEMMEC
ncbi:MAG: isopenicillin N synthase family oxygenase [Alphaproteobacteria bacterium]|nr:isopenicillin N synthase family oxygenase [Alphaproteobacteria bacterium]